MTAQPSYRDSWEPVNRRGGLHEFRDMYWGARGRAALKTVLARPPLERFLHVRQAAVQNLFQMDFPDGLLFVREDYRILAERLRKARKQKTVSQMQGCLLFGQEGVGKTYFLLFLLMQCLSLEEKVLFTSSIGDTYLFDEDSVIRIQTTDFTPCIDIPEDVPSPSQRVWSLVDCSPAKEPIPSSVTHGTRQLFFVAAARPYCGAPKERFNIRKWWLSHWTEDELRALLTSIPPDQFPLTYQGRYPLSTPDTARSLIRNVGRCPQDILSYLTSPGQYDDTVNAALLQYTNVEALFSLLSGRDSSGCTNDDSHNLVLLSHAGPVSPDAIDADDRAVAHFKTRAIHNRVLAHLQALPADDTQQLHATLRASGGPLRRGLLTAAFADPLLFESHAIQYVLNVDPPSVPPLRRSFAPMSERPTLALPDTDMGARRVTRAQTAAPVRFACYSPSDIVVDVVEHQRTTTATAVVLDAAGGVAWRRARAEERPRPGCEELWCVWGQGAPWADPPARGWRFDSVADLCADLRHGARHVRGAGAGDGSLFDVYRLDVRWDDAVVWAVRVATPRAFGSTVTVGDGGGGGGGGGGFAEVAQLKEQLGRRGKRRVRVKYVVVVPYEEPGFAVEWSLPAGFEEHPGGVFVQFLDVRAFGGDVAQVLGVPRPDADADGGPVAGTSGVAKRGAKRKRRED